MSADGPTPRFRALVAEDYADFRARLLALLSHLPVDWVAVADGEAAIEVVRDTSAPLDLLITDLDMPRRTGWEVIDAFRSHRGPALPVILQTGEARYADVRKRAAQLGVVLIDKIDVPVRLPGAVCQALGLVPS